jgi:hypothetical protein
LIESFEDNIRTDLSPAQLSQLACLGTQMPPQNIALPASPQELFKQTRVFDPVFDKRISILDADFTSCSEYVAQFQAGTWPRLWSSTPPSPPKKVPHSHAMNKPAIPPLNAAAVLKRSRSARR